MLKVLFLSLIVMSFNAFGQKQEKPEAYKFFETEKISNKLLKEKTEEFYENISKKTDSRGLIINYGSRKEIAEREKQIRALINFRDPNVVGIAFITGENKGKLKTVFWVLPVGAEFPVPISGNKVTL